MSTPTVEVLVGIVASGKSEYARARAHGGAILVSAEAMEGMMLGGVFGRDDERTGLVARAAEVVAAVALVGGRDVVVDGEHLTKEARARWVKLAKDVGASAVAVLFPADDPAKHAKRRMHREGPFRALKNWRRVAELQFDRLTRQPPSTSEGFGAVLIEADAVKRSLSPRP